MSNSNRILNFVKQVASLARHPKLAVYSVDGKYNGERLSVLVADDGSTLSYISDLIFPDGYIVSGRRSISALRGPNLADSEADLVVVGANQLLRNLYVNQGFLIIPKWIELFLPVSEEPYARLYSKGRQTRKYFKWMIKKVEDAGFKCETITNTEWLDVFYKDMYRPYALERFGAFAVVHNRKKIKRAFKRGTGIVAKRNDESVAGTIVYRKGDTMRIPHVGVLRGDLSIVREGAAFAMDYYAAQMAHTTGCEKVDFGHSRPFLSDGTLQYKLNWHMDVEEDDDGVALFAIIAPGNTDIAMKFLKQNRFFHITREGIRLFNE